MKRLLLAGVVLAGCGPRDASPKTASAPAVADVTVVGADPGVDTLPDLDAATPEATAGLYWIPYRTCRDCASPKALVAYVAPDVATARAIRDALEGKLRLGLPYVIHTEQINATPSGIAVVTGSYGTHDAATAAAGASSAIAGVTPIVLDVDKEHWYEALHHVTVIDRGPPTPAWSAEDARNAEDASELRDKTPLCSVAPGDLFVVEDHELLWYRFAPVRCGKDLAYVAWTRSLLGHAVIVRGTNGRYELHQVVDAECDSPVIQTWDYDERGRHEQRSETGELRLAGGGC